LAAAAAASGDPILAHLAESYRALAARATADADTATLENVRDRNLRAAHAWEQMADRQDRTERAREERETKTEPQEST